VNPEAIQILLVEDSPSDVELTIEAMREAKVANQMWVVADGVLALDFLRQKGQFATAPRPDLVLLDLNLPRKNGTEVLADMRADPLLRAIPVAVLTTSRAESDVLRSYELGVNCFVTKPVGLAEFLEVIEAIQDFWLAVVRLPSRDEAWKARSRTALSAQRSSRL
jgi:two-component system, chemotaxis family, response regulator Rcp1